jgi:hypothetical protein
VYSIESFLTTRNPKVKGWLMTLANFVNHAQYIGYAVLITACILWL